MQFGNTELPSNRSFGLFFAAIFAALALYLFTADKNIQATLSSIMAIHFAAAAILRPGLLIPLNKAWMSLGYALGTIVSPIVLGILFFAVFTPLALLLRAAGRDELRLRRLPAGTSYWRLRNPPGPPAESFRRQF